MEGCIRLVWMSLLLICGVQCNTENLISSIDGVKEQMLQAEKRMMNHIDSVKMSLQTGLKKQMDQQKQTLEEIIKGNSFKDVLRSKVVAEIKKLRRGQNKMNRQLRLVLKSLRELQQERELCKDDKQNAEVDEVTSRAPEARSVSASTSPQDGTTKSPTVAVTASFTTAVTSQVMTTLSPDQVRSRIIVAPLFAKVPHQLLDVSIDNNTLNNYILPSKDRIVSLVYAANIRKLLIARYQPKQIIASPLDTDQEEILLEDVLSYGMAVDEERQIIFLTTESPWYTVSRITTEGENLTLVVNVTGYGYYPRAIAVDPRERKIYSCNHVKVFTVRYNGEGLETLAEGRHMSSVTLDNTGSILFFNHDYDLKKLSLADNVTTTLTTLSEIPWTSRYYRNKVYFSSNYNYLKPPGSGMIGAVDLGEKVTSRTMHSFNMVDGDYYAICLVP